MSLSSLAKDPQYMGYLSSLEEKYGLPSGLLKAQQQAESNFNPAAVSPAGAQGVAQFMPATAKQYGIDPMDPIQASEGQARMLSDLARKYNGDIPSVLAGYNWGSGNLDRKGMENAPAETRGYISKVMASLPGQSDQGQQAPASALSRMADAVGSAIIPPAQAGGLQPGDAPTPRDPFEQMANAEKDAYAGAAQPAANDNPYAQIPDDQLLAEAQKAGLKVDKPSQDFSKMSDDELLAAAQQSGLKVETSDLGRLAAIGAKGAVSGAAQLPMAGLDLAMALPHAVGAIEKFAMSGKMPTLEDFTPLSSGAQNIVNAVGPTPQNQGERLLEDMTRGVGSVATAPGVSGLKALISGAAGGFGGGATREAGGGPVLQALASLVAGGGAYAGLSAIEKPAMSALDKVSSMFGNVDRAIGGDKMTPVAAAEEAGSQIAEQPKAPVSFSKEQPLSEGLHDLASQSYAKADAVGGTLIPEVTNKFVDEATNAVPQTRAGKMLFGDSPAAQLVERIKGLKDSPVSLAEAQEIDEGLSDAMDGMVTKYGKLNKQGNKFLQVQTNFRNAIMEATPEHITGGKEGFTAWREGQKYWSQMLKARDVEKIMQRAEQMEVPATGVKTGFRTLLSNPSRTRGWTKPELAAARQAAKHGVLTGTLKLFGSRLIPIGASVAGGAVGHVPGAIVSGLATHAATSLARGAATKLQMGRAESVLREIAKTATKGAK